MMIKSTTGATLDSALSTHLQVGPYTELPELAIGIYDTVTLISLRSC